MPRNTRIDLNALRKLVARSGDVMIYTPGQWCPCKVGMGNPNLSCLICGGTGYFWDDTRRTQIKGIIFTPMMHKELVIEGQFEQGDLLVSQDAGRMPLINVNDRIELTTTAGEGYAGEVRTTSLLGGQKRTILSFQPTMIESVISGNPLTGAIERYHVVEHERNSDRDDDVNVDGYFERLQPSGQAARWITWLPNRGPDIDESVSVKYRARYEYVCVEQPEFRFQRDDDLGQLVHLRLKNRITGMIPDQPNSVETPIAPAPEDNKIRFT